MKKLSVLSIIIVFLAMNLNAQNTTESITIQTSAQCEMCKEAIEKAMAYEKGVVSSNLDMETMELVVKFRSHKTNPDKIRKAISEIGYDADDVKANPRAYSKLDNCCKKPEDR